MRLWARPARPAPAWPLRAWGAGSALGSDSLSLVGWVQGSRVGSLQALSCPGLLCPVAQGDGPEAVEMRAKGPFRRPSSPHALQPLPRVQSCRLPAVHGSGPGPARGAYGHHPSLCQPAGWVSVCRGEHALLELCCLQGMSGLAGMAALLPSATGQRQGLPRKQTGRRIASSKHRWNGPAGSQEDGQSYSDFYPGPRKVSCCHAGDSLGGADLRAPAGS